MSNVVTRIAPSPTGHMHIGTVRTALFNYLFAKQNGGTYFVRIEDTDKKRNRPEWVAAIWEDFEWCNLMPDARYVQSENLPQHQAFLKELVSKDKAYLSKEPSKENPDVEVEVVRLRNPGSRITFTDIIHGEVSFDTAELGDFVIARSMEDPLYHLAVVADDAEAGVTHIIRAEEHLSNTPRQILIQEALGFSRPQYAHIPLILAPDRSKLSKRHGAVSVNEYRAQGFIPEAMVNYLALLGWNPGTPEELFSLDQLVERFSLTQVQKSGAIFDEVKLGWFNHEHLKRLTDKEYAERFEEYLSSRGAPHPGGYAPSVVPLLKERAATFGEALTLIQEGEFAFLEEGALSLDAALLLKGAKADADTVAAHLTKVSELLSELPEDSSAEEARALIFPYADEAGRASVLWPLRVALSGKEKSPDPFTIIALIGKKRVRSRIADALQKLYH